MGSLDASTLAHSTLRRLRQADTLPVAQICRQVQQENYHDWKRWEARQDFSTVMHGRYGLLFTDTQLAASFTPEPDPDTLPLFAKPIPQKGMAMDLLKLSITKDALVSRAALHARIGDDGMALLPTKRGTADNIRKALAYRLKGWQTFHHGNALCHAKRTSTTGGGLDEWVYVQSRTEEVVKYTEAPICQITGNGEGQPWQVSISPGGYAYGDLLNAIGSARGLQTFGEQHYFESDLRKLALGLLKEPCVPFWPGILLALSPEAHEAAQRVQGLLEVLIAGSGKVSLMSLDNTPANREALARELAEGFTAALDKLTERAGHTAPVVEALQAEYAALCAKMALAESVLGVEIDCLEAQVSLELALSAAVAA